MLLESSLLIKGVDARPRRATIAVMALPPGPSAPAIFSLLWWMAAGTYVLPCVYLAQRHPAHWDAPSEFRPERFLDKKPDPYAWIPFGGGARRCIGMAFALFEMRVVLATLLPRVRLRLPDKPAKVTLRSFLFAPSGGPRVIVEERTAGAA